MGAEFAGKGVNVSLGPTTNLVRDPRWGRTYETYGEDPYLAGQITSAEVDGHAEPGRDGRWSSTSPPTTRSSTPTAATTRRSASRRCRSSTWRRSRPPSSSPRRPSFMCSYAVVNSAASCQNADMLQRRAGQRRRTTAASSPPTGAPTTTTSPPSRAAWTSAMPFSGAIATDLAAALAAGTLSQCDGQRGRRPDPDPDVRLRHVRQPADRLPLRHRHQRGAPADRAAARRGGHGPAEEQRHPAAQPERHRVDRGDRHRRRRRRSSSPAAAAARSTSSNTIWPITGIQNAVGPNVKVTYTPGNDNGTTDIPQAVAAAQAATDAIIYVNAPGGRGERPDHARPVQHGRDDDRARWPRRTRTPSW